MKTKKILFGLTVLMLSINSYAQQNLSYFINKEVEGTFEEVTEKVKIVLKEQGFGVITEINMDVKIKEKLEYAELKPYKILGVCNPKFAYETLQVEENIGLFLPCKVLVKQIEENRIEVVMVNPSVLMSMLGNRELENIANEVTEKFKIAIEKL